MSATPPPFTPPTVGYRTPDAYARDAVAYREGALIVSPPRIRLPEGCVKCGAPEDKVYVKKLYWHHQAIYLVVLFNVLIYLIVSLIVRKRGDVTFGLCAEHVRKRRLKIAIPGIIALVTLAAVIGFFVLASRQQANDIGPFVGIFGSLFFFGSLIAMLVNTAILKPKFIDAYQMKLAGAGEAYLQRVEAASSSVPTAMPV